MQAYFQIQDDTEKMQYFCITLLYFTVKISNFNN